MPPFTGRYLYAPIHWSVYLCPHLLVGICMPQFISRNIMPPFIGRNIMSPFIGRYLYAITNVYV